LGLDNNWTPVINARTATNMFQFRYGLELADAKIRAQQLEIGFMIQQFANAAADLATKSQLSSPLDAL
jgi:hypothetical protein